MIPRITPYEPSEIIFIDTEFSDLDPMTGEIVSLGIVTLSGDELYLELEAPATSSEWVRKHILPTLTQPKVSVEQAKQLVHHFIGPRQPYAVAFVDNDDVI